MLRGQCGTWCFVNTVWGPGWRGNETHLAQREETVALSPLAQPMVRGFPIILPPHAIEAHPVVLGATMDR